MSSGKVVTFYSYKGGVGRTLALANVAVCLVRWGYRVLCIDWDLEAPGLHLYFKSTVQPDSTPSGLVDLVDIFYCKYTWQSLKKPWHLVRIPYKDDLRLTAVGRNTTFDCRRRV